jgi:tripartite-type tricarboxylate transporter receptor subunit TctC
VQKRLVAAGLVGLAAALSGGTAAAQPLDAAYPVHPIRLVVGYSAGGGNDILARLLAGRLSEDLHQPVLVDNRPGAQSIVACELVAKSAPDGYTLLVAPTGPMTINPAIYSRLSYSPLKDFAPVSIVGDFPLILAVSTALPVNSVQELIDYAKSHPASVNYASSAAPFQVAAELFNQRTGTHFAHIPYKGSGDSVNAVISGEVTMTISDSLPIAGQLKGGRLRGLAVTAAQRSPHFPDIPTMAEAGLNDMVIKLFSGVVAPAGTPAPVIRRLIEAIVRTVALPDVQERFTALGMEPVTSSPEEFTRVIAQGIERWTAVAKAANIKAD